VCTIYLPVSSGINARDLLECGLVQALAGERLVAVSPLAVLEEFRRRTDALGVSLVAPPAAGSFGATAIMARSRAWVRHRPLVPAVWRSASRLLCRELRGYWRMFDRQPPDAVVIPTPRRENELDIALALAAQLAGIPTICVVSSWDNPGKGRFRAHCDAAAVWNDDNRRVMIRQHGYGNGEVRVTGPLQFDPYFRGYEPADRPTWCRRWGLDPSRPVILLCTAGPFIRDQTFLVDELVRARGNGTIHRASQILIRVHFADKTEFFRPYESLDGVRVQWHARWYRMLGPYGWTMHLEDIHHMADTLTHSDVVVSMGSTVTVEAAVFDTPALVVSYSPYEPDAVARIIEGLAFKQHFRPLVERSLIPVARSRDVFLDWVRTLMADRSVHRQERRAIVAEIVQFTDGRSAERVAHVIREMSGSGSRRVTARDSQQLVTPSSVGAV
jgi:hypothetical protein